MPRVLNRRVSVQTLDVSKRKKAKKPAFRGHETTHKENVDETKAADVDEAGPSDTGKARKRKKTRSHSSEGKLSGARLAAALGEWCACGINKALLVCPGPWAHQPGSGMVCPGSRCVLVLVHQSVCSFLCLV